MARYQGRLSGPLLDRIDLHVEVPCIDADELRSSRQEEGSAEVRQRIASAREHRLRFAPLPLSAGAADTLARAARKFAMSTRAIEHSTAVARAVATTSTTRATAPGGADGLDVARKRRGSAGVAIVIVVDQ